MAISERKIYSSFFSKDSDIIDQEADDTFLIGSRNLEPIGRYLSVG